MHQTLHCALSGAPTTRVHIPFLLCAVRWCTGQLLCAVRCAPDMHCRLSGAPISRFKKRPPARDRARGSLLLPASALSLCLAISPLTGDLLSPAAILRRPRQCSSPLGEQPPPLLCLLSLCVSLGSATPFCIKFKSCEFLCNPVQPSCEMCSPVFLEYSCRFSAPSGGFSHLKWPFLRNPNSSPSKCSVKCPN